MLRVEKIAPPHTGALLPVQELGRKALDHIIGRPSHPVYEIIYLDTLSSTLFFADTHAISYAVISTDKFFQEKRPAAI